ncbi:Calcium uniporter protein C-terminal [Dioscorea alata]|uniref:Calcium uniporter protein C-terminal n=1 Tax=Dioscorea alata TaxID=55571 RepID=A0ACB7WQP7_DIOAL|nr:Calcium uniporter protein C-terminal [Dioscorea alata]
MAFRKTLAKIYSQIRAPMAATTSSAGLRRRMVSESGVEEGLLRRILQRRPIFQAAVPPDRWIPTGDRLIERIRGLNRDRIQLDCLVPPPSSAEELEDKEEVEEVRGRVSMEEVKKVLRASQMETVRARLREIPRSSITYSEFLEICCKESGSQHGMGVARALDESGAVIVLGNVVFLRPDQVVKAIESVVTPNPKMQKNDPRKKELEELEKKKIEIDNKAETQVKRELWFGLGLLILQTGGFMRLTFWELSWDVMEPICFFVTSIYFMAGYAFFLRTSKDPSFEGFFESRFEAKQRRLMLAGGFDAKRFYDLRKALGRSSGREELVCCDCHNKRDGFIAAPN